ncbi:MAG: response regulator transcription factor [candidate division KSB1 bacterium]|nr:response regulator transcription factor [candidate division KSB1 bacterium]MDQ7066400.1 response regulator transcription factor [candidate division KSB1 bacterium]
MQKEEFEVEILEDDKQCEHLDLQKNYDLILLNLALPHKSGFDLCEEWRKEGLTIPIIVVTAKGAPKDVVRALEGGADDYIIKPFSFEELVARIQANLRRISMYAEQLVYRVDDLYVDIVKRESYSR